MKKEYYKKREKNSRSTRTPSVLCIHSRMVNSLLRRGPTPVHNLKNTKNIGYEF